MQYCFVCGKQLIMRYPAGDPENGPASLRCVDNSHSTIDEICAIREMEQKPEELLQVVDESIGTIAACSTDAKIKVLREVVRDQIKALTALVNQIDASVTAETDAWYDDLRGREVDEDGSLLDVGDD